MADLAAEKENDRGVVGPGEQRDHRADRAIYTIEVSERAQIERDRLTGCRQIAQIELAKHADKTDADVKGHS